MTVGGAGEGPRPGPGPGSSPGPWAGPGPEPSPGPARAPGRIPLGAWAPPAAWCALIFVLSSLPLRSDAVRFPGADKVAHLLEYGVLGFLLARALRASFPSAGEGGVVAAAALLGTAYGLSDEIHQSFVPAREASAADLAADAAGALAGAALLSILRRRGGAPTSPGTAAARSGPAGPGSPGGGLPGPPSSPPA